MTYKAALRYIITEVKIYARNAKFCFVLYLKLELVVSLTRVLKNETSSKQTGYFVSFVYKLRHFLAIPDSSRNQPGIKVRSSSSFGGVVLLSVLL